MVAGLFILVEAVNYAGALHLSQILLHSLQSWNATAAALTVSFGVGVGANLINNLPLGLIAGASVREAHIVGILRNAILIGIDLGPNLSVTGSLATILWLVTLRRERLDVTVATFLRLGLLVMPPALVLSMACMLLFSPAS